MVSLTSCVVPYRQFVNTDDQDRVAGLVPRSQSYLPQIKTRAGGTEVACQHIYDRVLGLTCSGRCGGCLVRVPGALAKYVEPNHKRDFRGTPPKFVCNSLKLPHFYINSNSITLLIIPPHLSSHVYVDASLIPLY